MNIVEARNKLVKLDTAETRYAFHGAVAIHQELDKLGYENKPNIANKKTPIHNIRPNDNIAAINIPVLLIVFTSTFLNPHTFSHFFTQPCDISG